MILGIRTDKPEAELYLCKEDGSVIDRFAWIAHKQLAETLHVEIDRLLNRNECSLGDITRIAVYSGPGSFTGLRIGISTANALAYGLDIPINGSSGDDWLVETINHDEYDQKVVLPYYGQDPHITQAKK